jgi:hypothetical protein
MTISGQSPISLLDSVLQAQTTQENMGVTMLKKAQDTATQEGEALVKMLEQTSVASAAQGQLLDTYA